MSRIGRRRFLQGAGGVALALPLLDLFRAGRAVGQPIVAPKRGIFVFTPVGTISGEWVPDGSETNFTLRKILAPLDHLKSKLTILQGVGMKSAKADKGNGHARGMSNMLTGIKMIPDPALDTGFGAIGYAGGISIDQHIANELPGETKFKSLEFGVRTAQPYGAHPYSRMSYTGPKTPAPAEDSPQKMFDRLFSELGVDPSVLAKIREQRKSVLDFVKDDLTSLSKDVGSTDRVRLEAHADAVRAIEVQIDASTSPVGANCQKPTLTNVPSDPMKQSNYQAVAKLQMDLLVMALICDLTRVASLQFSTAQSGIVHSWVGADKAQHSLSHEGESNTDARNQLINIGVWHAEQLAYLADRLDEVDEGGKSLLDNSFICNVTEISYGFGNKHSYDNMPYLLLGSCGGALKTGRFTTLNDKSSNDLFITLMNAMGVSGNTFGDPQFCSGQLSTLLV